MHQQAWAGSEASGSNRACVKFQKLTTDGDNIGRITLAMKVTIAQKSRKGGHRRSIRRLTKSSDTALYAFDRNTFSYIFDSLMHQ
jgi:hypothetical protein